MHAKMVWQSWVQLPALEEQVVIEDTSVIWVMGNLSTAWIRRGPLRVKTGLSLWWDWLAGWDCLDLAPEPVFGRSAVVC